MAAEKLDLKTPQSPAASPSGIAGRSLECGQAGRDGGEDGLSGRPCASYSCRTQRVAARTLPGADRTESGWTHSVGSRKRTPFAGPAGENGPFLHVCCCPRSCALDRRAIVGATPQIARGGQRHRGRRYRDHCASGSTPPAGDIIIGGKGKNVYELDKMPGVCAVIDLGGDDEYREGTVSPDRPVLVVIDLAGNDTYIATKAGCPRRRGAGRFDVAGLGRQRRLSSARRGARIGPGRRGHPRGLRGQRRVRRHSPRSRPGPWRNRNPDRP